MTVDEQTAFRNYFKRCRDQLTQFQQRAPASVQPKITIALSSLTAAETRFEEKKDYGDVLYLLGRVNWTLGFIAGQPKEKAAGTLAEAFAEEGDEDEETPIVDAILQS